jgi:SAM-dependent methyltransferase
MTHLTAPEPPLYDLLSGFYDRWLTGDDAAQPCLAFYVDELRDDTGPVLELGAGTGRISRALADAGIAIVGLDASMKMLRHGRAPQGADRPPPPTFGVATAVCALFECLPFADGAFTTVILPMRTLGHLVDSLHRCAMFDEVARTLRAGGRFMFDHYNLDRGWAEEHDGRPRLMYAGAGDAGDDSALLIWDRYDYDFDARTLHCTVLTEEVRPGLLLRSTSSVEFDFRWFQVDEIREHAAQAGFAVEQCWGDFDRTLFKTASEHMVFVLRKP